MGVVVGNAYLNTESGLSAPGGLVDRLTAAMDARAQNNMQLQGLAAGGIIPQSAAPGPSVVQQLISMFTGGGAPTSGGQAPAPAPMQQPGPVSLGPGGGAPGGAPMSYAPMGGGTGAPPQMTAGGLSGNALASYIGQKAQQLGIDPMTALRVAQSEGGFSPATAGDANSSFGPFQLHYASGGAGPNAAPGLGDDFTRATGLDARDPRNATAAIDFALQNASKNGWGAFHGAAKAGVGQWDGISRGQGGPMPQATATGPMSSQAMAFSGNTPPATQAATPAQGGAAPATAGAPPPGGGGQGGAPTGALQPGTQIAGPGSRLNGMISLPEIQRLIFNPATREQGLQLWQMYLQPPQTTFGKAGEGAFVNGRYVGQIPSAPMSVEAGNSVIDPNTGRTIAATAPKLQAVETTPDMYGQQGHGAFNPQTGAVTPFPGAPGVVPQASAAGAGGAPTPNAPPTGDAFLATISPALAGQVKAIAEGRAKMPAAGSRSPMAMRIASMVQQYDPNFDQANADARFATRESFAHGPFAQTIVSGNTAIQHLGDLSDAAEALNNSSSPLYNRATQALGSMTGGNVAGHQFANTLNDFTGELVKFYRGTGGSEHDIEAAKEALDPSQSPAQLRAGIAQQAQLISGKTNSLNSQWHQSMGPLAQDYPIIQPKSQAALDRISQRAAPAQAQGGSAQAQRLTPEQARALPPGTPFVGTDGIARVRH